MREEREGPPRFVKPAAWLIVIVILGGVAYAVYRLGAAFDRGLDQVAQRRARDAGIVRAQREAGRAYMDKVSLEMEPLDADASSESARLKFQITNNGGSLVKKAVAEITVPARGGGEPYVEEVILFDDTATSVRPDKPLGPGEKREVFHVVEAGRGRDWENAKARIKEMRLETAER